MNLEKIKLAGFKSFVDPTSVSFPSNLVAIVGPNGCGKSNLIDAVRWVMGESSAKNLRGESITDVIFNGSTHRKPVGQASIELVFNNSDGTLGGEFAQYSQISILRQVNREGQSSYFLNGTRCRRRDITQVFLGTGLGPRSYAIIEQGMISRLVEAKPEELRAYLEEVAGISKYKERRRETENRISHTRENLNRLNDLREEIDKQLSNLKRQANAAERYKVLREEERLCKAQLLALRWQYLDKELADCHGLLQKLETALQATIAEQRRIDAELTQLNELKYEVGEEYSQIQSEYYAITNEITRLEQAIAHQKQRRIQLQQDLEQAEFDWQEVQRSIQEDDQQIADLNEQLLKLTPEAANAKEVANTTSSQQIQAEQAMRDWQSHWDEFNQRAAAASQSAQVAQTRIQHLEHVQQDIKRRLEKNTHEKSEIHFANLPYECEAYQQQLEELAVLNEEHAQQLENLQQRLLEQREQYQASEGKVQELREELQTTRAQYASLEALQEAALGQQDVHLQNWLSTHHLQQNERLVHNLKVEAGWEQAVETVLGHHLHAVCVNNTDSLAEALSKLEKGEIVLVDQQQPSTSTSLSSSAFPLLLDKVQCSWPLHELLAKVFVASDLHEALKIRHQLNSTQSVITPDGVWMSRSWLRVAHETDAKAGIVQRESTLQALQQNIVELEADLHQAQQQTQAQEEILTNLQEEREELWQSANNRKAKMAELNSQLQIKQARLEHLQQRISQLKEQSEDLHHQLQSSEEAVDEVRKTWQAAIVEMEKHASERETLLKQRESYQQMLEEVRHQARYHKDEAHQVELRLQNLQNHLNSLQQAIMRSRKQVEGLQARREQLRHTLSENEAPGEKLQEELEEHLEKRLYVEESLTQAKQKFDNLNHDIRKLEDQRQQADQAMQAARSNLENSRLQQQELKVRQVTLQEQLTESQFDANELLQSLPEVENEKSLSSRLEDLSQRIARLGAINLAAIEEYAVQLERKTYLDAQNADLEQALQTLEAAIQKIDKETRHCFKETVDRVNQLFQELFPRVFNGGRASLELTGTDLLNAGLAVMAQPPGKRNSTIHLLSGGEKTLTAIALVFSMFQLNPAPFCMLDEVDAPLDDANINRFCNLLKEMANKVQFIFISHNKIAIETGQHLIGVTMSEPGVSRIVAVDVDQAIAMTEQAA